MHGQQNINICRMLSITESSYTCFGHISWPSSGSYKFGHRVHCIWQLIIIEELADRSIG